MAAVRKIYSQFNMTLTPDVEAAMLAYMKDNPKYKHGMNKYSLEKYGISEAELHDCFHDFIEYFKNGSEMLLSSACH